MIKVKGIHEQFATDKEAEVQGVWLDYELGDVEVCFKVSRMGKSNKKYVKAFDKRTRKHKHAIANGTIAEKKAEAIEMDVFIDAILLDWKGLETDEGPLQLTRENAIEVFTTYPDLYEDVKSRASEVSTFREAELESDVKN
jgi:hypothetical protein